MEKPLRVWEVVSKEIRHVKEIQSNERNKIAREFKYFEIKYNNNESW